MLRSHSFPLPLRLRRLVVIVAGLLVFAGSGLTASVAQAAGDDTVRRMDVTAVAEQERGTLRVTQDFEMEFNGGDDHGPFVYLISRQAIAGDDSRWRVLEISDPRVTSPTGAPVEVKIEREGSTYGVRIGDPDRTVKGRQHYVLTYAITGLVNPDAEGGKGDEIYWNVIGNGWELPIDDVTVTLQGPAAVTGTTCYAGRRDSTDRCTSHAAAGDRAVFTQDHLGAGQGLSVVGEWPVGTFVNAAPIYTERYTPGNTLRPTAGAFGIGLGSLAVLGGLAALRAAPPTSRGAPGLRSRSGAATHPPRGSG